MQLVFVCSGNTCRSPLALCAWHLAVREISARGGSKRGATFGLGKIEATSAGLCATQDAPAAFYAQTIAREWGENLSTHRAQLFRPEQARADLIIAMTGDQIGVMRAHFSVTSKQVGLLGDYAPLRLQLSQSAAPAPLWAEQLNFSSPISSDAESDILDPFGGSLEAYEACATQIRRCVFELAHAVSGLK